jgi:hypothetical protein
MYKFLTRNTKSAGGKLIFWYCPVRPIFNETTGRWEANRYDMGMTTQQKTIPRFLRKWATIIPYGGYGELTMEVRKP